MSYTLDQFASASHDLLKAEPGASGREKIRALLEVVLRDEAFLAKYLTDVTPEREILYEDAEFGFCILAHVYPGAKSSPPHDHGPFWAIYGQASGETQMQDWEVVEPATEDSPGKVRPGKSYKLTPGIAHLYNEGQVHSPSRRGPTRLIRIEGSNMKNVKRLKFEAV